MKIRTHIHRKSATRIALGLAVAAIAAPSALAASSGQATIPEGYSDRQLGPANIVTLSDLTIPAAYSHRELGPANFVTGSDPQQVTIPAAYSHRVLSPANVVTGPVSEPTIPAAYSNRQLEPANFVTPIPVGYSNRQLGPANFVTTPVPVQVVGGNRFDFRDAAVGAAIAIAALLLAAAAFLVLRKRGHLAGA